MTCYSTMASVYAGRGTAPLANNDRTELILSTIAVVLAPGVSPPSGPITPNVLEDILRRPLSISQGAEGPIVNSNRDQVEIQFFPNKIDVRESSGNITQAKIKIPRIIHGFCGALPAISIRSYGINFISEIEVESPGEWLGNNLLNPSLASKLATSLSSKSVTLLLDRPPKEWTVRLEALPGDRLNSNFNASESTTTLPSQETLGHEIGQQYAAFNEFLTQIGLQI